jgi:hypothetical protein
MSCVMFVNSGLVHRSSLVLPLHVARHYRFLLTALLLSVALIRTDLVFLARNRWSMARRLLVMQLIGEAVLGQCSEHFPRSEADCKNNTVVEM